MASGKYFLIRSQLNGLVLSVADGNKDPGARLTMSAQTPEFSNHQLFYEDTSTGTLRCKLNDFCIDVHGEHIILSPPEQRKKGQQWLLNGSRINNRGNQNRVIDIQGADPNPGARILVYDYNGGANQHWVFEYVPPRYFYIRSQMNNKVLDVRGAETAPGAQIIMYGQNRQMCDNQLWYEDRYGVIRSKINNCAMDASGGILKTQVYDPGNLNQQWTISGNCIVNKHNNQQVLDIQHQDSSDNAKIISHKYHGGSNQMWTFEFV